MRREFKIGLLGAGALALLIWGFEFLKGRNILFQSQIFYVEYENVDQLRASNPIVVNGLQVGIVKGVYLNSNDLNRIIVELDVEKYIKVPEGTIAEILTTSMMGGRVIQLVFPPECQDGSCPAAGDTLQGRTLGFLNSMVGTNNVETYMDILEDRTGDLLDMISKTVTEDSVLSKSGQDIAATLTNLRNATARLDRLLAGDVSNSLSNISTLSNTLAQSQDKIKGTLDNLEKITSQLSTADLGQTVDQADQAISQIQTSLEGIDAAVKQLKDVLTGIQNGEGTLGGLAKDKTLYDNLNKTLLEVEKLSEDIRLNPKRYTRVLSKKQIPYEEPAEAGGDN